ncbi:hypothetical protein PILCRDRAFT_824654 [Piloderma croceum F 1598]|uniref:SET domain-containing protein n=1 Tax=Piloderma croceum (strain F 1598) TaxID=765440 RepID=A0A0C3F087_PILCF|nr:hypothetical protein PILCRDRAFT_824654 [Piloderma croceum F 1598]
MSSHVAADSTPQISRDVVRFVFHSVWEDFYDWEATHCQSAIKSLGLSLYAPHASDVITLPRTRSRNRHRTNIIPAPPKPLFPATDQSNISCLDYTQEDYPVAARPVVEVINVPKMSAPPVYESVTPATRSIHHGDDDDSMAFVPYADEPTFDALDHTLNYGSFSWQDKFCDPDIELIVMETALRLESQHQVSFFDIDETGLLPLKLLPRPGNNGLAHKIRHRDLPNSPTLHFLAKFHSRPVKLPGLSDLQSRLESVVSIFCPSLNCLQPYCAVHIDALPMSQPAIPQVLNRNMIARCKRPCGDKCFVIPPTLSDDTMQWSETEIETFRTILNLTPDLIPCDLSTICRKPCREVFAQRRVLLSDDMIVMLGNQKARRPLQRAMKFDDLDPNDFTPNNPCSHAGPCDHRAQCSCYLNKTHCERSCRCSMKCSRRWRGCQCARNKLDATCGTERCPCRKANRECDPDICTKCKAKDAFSDICQNASLQQGRRKGLKVKESQWGLGTFLTGDVKAGDLLAEYTGELIYEPTTESREDVVKYRDRNYVFGLNTTVSIDSSYAGNETRFINHVPRPKANSCPQVWLVNGEHRIGIFATRDLQAGTEVTFDYGPQFFTGADGAANMD